MILNSYKKWKYDTIAQVPKSVRQSYLKDRSHGGEGCVFNSLNSARDSIQSQEAKIKAKDKKHNIYISPSHSFVKSSSQTPASFYTLSLFSAFFRPTHCSKRIGRSSNAKAANAAYKIYRKSHISVHFTSDRLL